MSTMPASVHRSRAATSARVAVATAALIAAPAGASQAITTIGSSSAQACYEAARDRRVAPPDLGQCEQALKGVLSPPDRVATHVNRGIIQALRGNYPAALSDYDRAIYLDPSEAEAFLNKGLLLLRMTKHDREALEVINLAIARKTTKLALAYFARAIANEGLGKFGAAYRDYQQAAMVDPDWSLPIRELSRFKKRS